MKDTFRAREKAYEAKFKLDEEKRFKAEMRRNRMLGEWAARKLGLTRAEREVLCKAVVISDLKEPGVEDCVRMVMHEFERREVPITETEICDELVRLLDVAIAEVDAAYPDPLGRDHQRVGD